MHRGLLAPPHEVLPRHGGERWFRCGPDLRSGALLLADQERPRDPREDAEQTGALHREAAGDRSGVHRVRRHPRTLQPPRQLEREEKIHQLRVAVLPDSQVAALHLEIAEIDPPAARGFRGDADHPRGRAGAQQVEQRGRKREIRHVVERECALEAFGRDLARAEHGSRVVHQHVQPRVLVPELRRDSPRFADQLQIRPDGVGAGLPLDGVELRRIAPDDHHFRAQPRELAHRNAADARRPARDQDDLPVHPRLRRARSISRFASRSAMSSRLSTPVFPLHTPSSTFTLPSLK